MGRTIKKEIVILPKVLLARIIDLLEDEDFPPTSVNLLKKVIPHSDYFRRIAQQLDKVMMYTDHHKKQMSISELVNSTFASVTQSHNNKVKSSNHDLCGDVVMIWHLIHALQVNESLLSDFQAISPPTDNIYLFYCLMKPIFDRVDTETKPISECVATEEFSSKPLDHVAQCKGRKTGDASNYNESKKYVTINGKLFKCQMVKVEGNLIKTYTKNFQCAMVLD